MRIERLTIEGFGPFAGRQEIDFRELDDAGLFLITGRTGSGKSSILDAVCFALYGSAPRYDGVQARLRSDHAVLGTPTAVELEFSVAGERWRVTRSPEYERPKRTGSGTTVQPQTATLERLEADGWTGVAARPVDVAEHLAPVLQLTREQFLQVILLAQGRFQEFLKARSEERLGLLRALFGTDRFERFEAEVADRAKALAHAVGVAAAAVHGEAERLGAIGGAEVPADAGPAWAAGVVQDLVARTAAVERVAAEADARHADADAAAAQAVAVADRQRRRSAARAALQRLDADRPGVEVARRRVAEAVRMLPLLPEVHALERADAALPLAAAAADAAQRAVGGPVVDPAGEGAALDGLIGALAGALEDERSLPRLTAAAAGAGERSATAAAHLAELLATAELLPARREGLLERRSVAALSAAGLPAAEAATEHARRVVAAIADAERTEAAVRRADEAHARALDDERDAVARTRALLTARLAGAAELLAAELVDGEPCPVCGSSEHPAPVAGDGTTPDDAAVAAAEAAQLVAATRRADASSTASELRAALAVAIAATDGATAASGAALVREAGTASAAVRRGVEEERRLTADLDRLAADGIALAGSVDAARVDVADRTADAAAAATALEAAVGRVSVAIAGDASVAARIARLRARRGGLLALEDAERRLAATRSERVAAVDRLAAALAAADVPDAAAVRQAALSQDGRRALEERIRAWETASDGALAQLADPDVAGAPEHPADVDGTAQTKAAALAERVAAGDAVAEARTRADAARVAERALVAADLGVAEDRERLAVVGPLAEVVRGGGDNALRMRLESYVLAARLEQIVDAANARLAAMTDGRFTLQHDDGVGYRGARSGLGLEVLDEHTGRPRPVASLSGGETFLASLALALGLAEVVSAEAGGVRLDTLFVDEGFGSLDRRTLDTAMETLDSLRAGGRTVGLISHVEAMQEDIPAGLHVERLPDGSSAIRSRIASPA